MGVVACLPALLLQVEYTRWANNVDSSRLHVSREFKPWPEDV